MARGEAHHILVGQLDLFDALEIGSVQPIGEKIMDACGKGSTFEARLADPPAGHCKLAELRLRAMGEARSMNLLAAANGTGRSAPN